MNKLRCWNCRHRYLLPEKKMTAKEVSEATNGTWSEEAVINKLGIVRKC